MAARHDVSTLETLEMRRLFATDLLSDAVGLTATTSIEVANTSYFFAENGEHGRELWKTDGTIAGTTLVKDLTPGASGTELVSLYEANGRLVFITVVHHPWTNRGRDDYTLWSSDGTAAGTVKLIEFETTHWFKAKQVGERVAIATHPLVEGSTSINDALLYFTDGTAAGTSLVKAFRGYVDEDGNEYSHWIREMYAAGDRVVFEYNGNYVWASDGTAAGTVDVTPGMLRPGWNSLSGGDVYEMFEYGGRVWVPGGIRIASTDGTLAGTEQRPWAVTGGFEGRQSKVSGDSFYFVNVTHDEHGDQYKALMAYHIPTGTLTQVYRPTDMHGESYFVTLYQIGDVLLMNVINHTHQTGSLWGVRGSDVEKIVDLGNDQSRIHSPVALDGTAYFVLTEGDFPIDYDPASGVPIGKVGSDAGGQAVYGGKTASIKVWRSDGTRAGTGVLRTLWEGDPAEKEVLGTLSTGTGVLLVRTVIRTGVTPEMVYRSGDLTTIWDDTLPYRPDELTMDRDVANARIVNGVLRLNGTPNPDRFRVYRPESDPTRLVVEVNGEARWFAFNSIRRIIADLQDGNDFLDVVEAPGRDIRLWTSVLGGDGADTILTATARDTIIGGSGPDLIRSRGNADLIIGGGGRDRITAGQGDDVILGGTGNDAILTNTGHDVLFGQNAVESVFGQLWEDGDEEEDLVLPGLF